MSLNLNERVFECLKAKPETKFTARQLAEWVFESNKEECNQKKAESGGRLKTDQDVIVQLQAEIGSHRDTNQKKHPEIQTLEERPRKYFYSTDVEKGDAAIEEVHAESGSTLSVSPISEYDMYPILCSYLHSEKQILTMRIDEKSSSNKFGKNGNKWLHPDIVGLEILSTKWEPQIGLCAEKSGGKRARLWSFEVKCRIERSNVRECFFQAVSNSAWANFGYLVAGEVVNVDVQSELQILSVAHGIGFILVKTSNPSESDIVFPAKERVEVDWNSANRLASENKDFRAFLDKVNSFYQTNKIHPGLWPEAMQE